MKRPIDSPSDEETIRFKKNLKNDAPKIANCVNSEKNENDCASTVSKYVSDELVDSLLSSFIS